MHPALKKANDLVSMYENNEAYPKPHYDYCLEMAKRYRDLITNHTPFDAEGAKQFLIEISEKKGYGTGWEDLRLTANYWFKRMLKPLHVKILPGFEWYDGYLMGLCEFKGQKRYFHWMEGGVPEDGVYTPCIYFVYNLDYMPELPNGWKDLDQYEKIGEFDEDEISPDSATLCDRR